MLQALGLPYRVVYVCTGEHAVTCANCGQAEATHIRTVDPPEFLCAPWHSPEPRPFVPRKT